MFIPASAAEENCQYPGCLERAGYKVEETIFPDDPLPNRHPHTAYLCSGHFNTVMKGELPAPRVPHNDPLSTEPTYEEMAHELKYHQDIDRTLRAAYQHVVRESRNKLATINQLHQAVAKAKKSRNLALERARRAEGERNALRAFQAIHAMAQKFEHAMAALNDPKKDTETP